MIQYASLFQICLVLYCVTSFAFIRKPLAAFAYFLTFRAALNIAAYLDIPAVGPLKFFIPAFGCLLIATFIAYGTRRFPSLKHNPLNLYFLLVGVIVLEGMVWALIGQNSGLFLQEVFKCLFPIMAYFLVYFGLRQESDLKRLSKYVMIISAIPIFTGIVGFALDLNYDYLHDTFVHGLRPAGTLINRNIYGIFLALCLFHTLPYILRAKTKASMLYLLLLLSAIVVAQNRGTWISLAIAFMVAVPMFKRYLNPAKWALGIVLVVMLASPIMIARFNQLNEYDDFGQKQNTAIGRLEHSTTLFKKSIESPLTGRGPGGYMIGDVADDLPHNDYLRIAIEYGFPAMFIYVGFLFSQLVWIVRRRFIAPWECSFAAVGAQVYLIVISVAQNIITEPITYMLIFAMMAMSHRAVALGSGTVLKKKPLISPKFVPQPPTIQGQNG